MNSDVSQSPESSKNIWKRHNKTFSLLILLPIGVTGALIIGTLICLRILGLICPYAIPTGAMAPAVSAGDHVLMENFTYLLREPRRGDIVVFKADGIDLLDPSSRYIKRVSGQPAERVRLSDDQLYINEKLTVLSNDFGGIDYGMPLFPPGVTPRMLPTQTNVTVPDASYFLLGDNSKNSLDSRFFGSVPRRNITGQIWFCYWPPQRVGLVK